MAFDIMTVGFFREGFSLFIITGATGHIGNNLVRYLDRIQANYCILSRSISEAIQPFRDHVALGDIFDPRFLVEHVRPGDVMIHLAAYVNVTDKDKEATFRINFDGARTIADFCLDNHVRLVFASSVDAIYKQKGEIVREPSELFPAKLSHNYAISKAMGTAYVDDLMKHQGLAGVIVYPSAVIGVHDYKPSAVGREIQRAMRDWVFAYIDGGYNFIDVEDVVKAIYAAAISDKSGGYILSGYDISIKDLYSQMFRILHKRPIMLWLPAFIARFGARLLPRYSPMMVDVLRENHRYDNTRMISDLLATLKPFDQTLNDTIDWFQKKKDRS